jgi:hypothetical protein
MSNNFWSHKPWWCQPWSILLTGSLAIAGSWLLLHIWWLSGGVALVVLAWWLLFLVVVPYTTLVEETEAKTP